MEEQSNIIKFPREYNGPNAIEDVTKDELDKRLNSLKIAHIDEALDIILESLMTNLTACGVQPTTEMQDIRYTVFMLETMKAYMFKKYKLDHPFQDLIESVILESNTGMFAMATNVNIDLKKTKDIAEN